MENEEHLIRNLIFLPKETQWFEFKHDNVDENEIGEYISALGNSATCEDKERAYLIWGIHDTTHDIIGTSFDPFVYKVGNEELENWLRRLLSSNAMFDFTTVSIDGKKCCSLHNPESHSHTNHLQEKCIYQEWIIQKASSRFARS